MDIVRNERRLRLARAHAMLACLRRQIKQMEFRAAHARFGIACTGAQHLVLPIVQLSHFPGKNIAEDKVWRLQNLLA